MSARVKYFAKSNVAKVVNFLQSRNVVRSESESES